MTILQKIIIPRNWLFGRLAYITINLNNILRNKVNFTPEERRLLNEALTNLQVVYKNKNIGNSTLKAMIKNNKL